jgi:chromosome segregation ATPase
MADDETEATSSGGNSVLRNVLLAIAVLYVIASLYLIFDSRSRLEALEKGQPQIADKIDKLTQHTEATDRNVKASTEELAQRLGMTQQELQSRMSARTAALERQQREAEERLAAEQKSQTSQLSQVSGEVAGVRSDLGSTKTDLASTKTDLEATKGKLERTIGDLQVQSGLIARNHDDLEELKRRGDRNYYEFTLQKGAHPTPVSTVSLQLKKADAKKSRFTLNVVADDKTIEKKDRTVAEPMQFYTGRDRVLYEVVVLSVGKNQINGYLSTPKSVPPPPAK